MSSSQPEATLLLKLVPGLAKSVAAKSKPRTEKRSYTFPLHPFAGPVRTPDSALPGRSLGRPRGQPQSAAPLRLALFSSALIL